MRDQILVSVTVITIWIGGGGPFRNKMHTILGQVLYVSNNLDTLKTYCTQEVNPLAPG